MTGTVSTLLKKMEISHHGAVELLLKVTANSYDADRLVSDRVPKLLVPFKKEER